MGCSGSKEYNQAVRPGWVCTAVCVCVGGGGGGACSEGAWGVRRACECFLDMGGGCHAQCPRRLCFQPISSKHGRPPLCARALIECWAVFKFYVFVLRPRGCYCFLYNFSPRVTRNVCKSNCEACFGPCVVAATYAAVLLLNPTTATATPLWCPAVCAIRDTWWFPSH